MNQIFAIYRKDDGWIVETRNGSGELVRHVTTSKRRAFTWIVSHSKDVSVFEVVLKERAKMGDEEVKAGLEKQHEGT